MDLLETARLRLRRMEQGDVPALLRIMGNPRVMYAWEYAFTQEQVEAWVSRNLARYARGEGGYYLAVRREDGACIGQLALMKGEMAGRSVWELGWILDEPFWGQGYATEGARALCGLAFARGLTDSLYADIRPENEKSIAVARRIGMQPTGESFKKTVNGKQMVHDVYCVSVGRHTGS